MVNNENSKQRILNSAIKLFARKSYEAVGIREICKEANVNLCMISYYFGGKRELYSSIIKDLIERQTEYAKTFMNINVAPENMTKKEQIDLLYVILDKFIDFFYSKISSDLILLLLKEQQNPECEIKSPAFDYLRELIACVFNLKKNGKEAIYQTLFIISQINTPRILPAFSLRLIGQDTFNQDDIKIIKNNINFYIGLMLKEKGIV